MTVRAATKRLFERLRDETVPAGAEFVVAPGSLEEARDAIVVAADAGMTVGFWGGGTHRGIGNPVEAEVMITTSRLDRVVDWQPEDLTVVVEPGVSVAALRAILSERGQTAVLPEDPGDATVGGVVAAGVSAFRRLRFGPTRDRVLVDFPGTGFSDHKSINSVTLMMSPDKFAIGAYRHYLRPENGAVFIDALLTEQIRVDYGLW